MATNPKGRIPRSIPDFNNYIRNSTEWLLGMLLPPIEMSVPKESSANALTLNFADAMTMTMENKSAGMGAPTLYFCTSLEKDGACIIGSSIALAPGETVTKTIAELGGSQKTHLNVTNPSADKEGNCKITICTNWKRLGMDKDEMAKWEELRDEWIPLHQKYSDKKAKRTTAIKDKMLDVQKRFIEFASPILNRIDGERAATIDDFEVLRIKFKPLKDETPSPVHGSHLQTGPPIVGLRNMGGGMIDVRVRRTSDATRNSMLKGFMIELRWLAGPPPPSTPDDLVLIHELSSKSRFQVVAGMANLGKTFYCYARWRHKTNPAILSPWANLMQIIIA